LMNIKHYFDKEFRIGTFDQIFWDKQDEYNDLFLHNLYVFSLFKDRENKLFIRYKQ